jgi:hypothetical protein
MIPELVLDPHRLRPVKCSGPRAVMRSVVYKISALLLFFAAGLGAQACLSLSPPVVSGDRTATLELSLHTAAKSRPAALQWTLSMPASAVTNVSVDDGPGLSSVRKVAICSGPVAAYRCMIVGANDEPVANGVVARITVNLVRGTVTPSITLRDSMAASTDGRLIPIPECSPPDRKE